jgi:hypothetical protein
MAAIDRAGSRAFTHYKVRPLFNNTDLNGPELIEPLES